MTQSTVSTALQITAQARPYLYGGERPTIALFPGITTLVGPNGAGKTQVMLELRRLIKQHLPNTGPSVSRYLSAGRASPLENFRSSSNAPHGPDSAAAHVGHTSYVNHWFNYESLTGDYLVLEQRPDLRLKVEARLQTFLARKIQLSWGQNGLEIRIAPTNGGDVYLANHEASGILQLAPLLAAIYNEEVGALLIDEPEVSLHPQYQAFIMQELQSVAGDPREDSTKKLVVVATHSPSILTLRSASDLPRIVFFNDSANLPVQIKETAPELKNAKLRSFIARLTATHRLAFFAKHVLLVEGPSDEIIVSQLARTVQHPLLPANTQIVPVTGKPEFVEAMRLFELMGKHVYVLADLDALTDSNVLVNKFNMKDAGHVVGAATGHMTLAGLDKFSRGKLAELVTKHWEVIEPIAGIHPYWANCPAEDRNESTKRRACLAILMRDGAESDLDTAVGDSSFSSIKPAFLKLFEALEALGCFILRRGTIEDYYALSPSNGSKPREAAEEAETFDDTAIAVLEQRFADVLRALRGAAPMKPIDENEFLRRQLGGALGRAFQVIKPGMTSSELDAACQHPDDKGIFTFGLTMKGATQAIEVDFKSPLFARGTEVPFAITESENLTAVIKEKLPAR